MENVEKYDYESSWGQYITPRTNCFLSTNDLLKICDCIDTNEECGKHKTSGIIPIHYDKGKLFVLKEGNTLVEGETGSKKSRTICRGAVIAGILNRDSIVVTDPKGEIYSDTKIQYLLQSRKVNSYVLDFRKFDKDGYNPMSHIFKLMKAGKRNQAMIAIDKLVEMIKEGHKGIGNDPFWDITAADLIRYVMGMLLITLSQIEDGEKYFNITTVKKFIRQDRSGIQKLFCRINMDQGNNFTKGFEDIINVAAEKTYSCIVASANALLSEFTSSEAILRMLSTSSTFDIRDFFEKPCVLFTVIPDEDRTFGVVTGYIFNQLYEILVQTYSEKYEGKQPPFSNIHFICDEAAHLKIQNISSKISAGRSRHIFWTLLYQSESQLSALYKDLEWYAVKGNSRHFIFLGSSDYQILKNVAEQTGDEVKIEDLRKMKKEQKFKDALVKTGGDKLYAAKLPDYDIYDFLIELKQPIEWTNKIDMQIYTYGPEDLYSDYKDAKISFSDLPREK